MSILNVDSNPVKSNPVKSTSTSTSLHSISSYLSGGGSSKSCVEAGKQSPLWGGARFLPSGDCLPHSFNLALIHKLPMFPPPTGALELYTHNLAEAPYKNKGRIDFDLTDPNNQCINTEYNPLTDPHMALFLHKPRVYKRLRELGQITHDDKVRCSRKQYGQYAKWLHHIGHQQFRKRADEERKKMAAQLRKARDLEKDLKVAVIHTEVSLEEQVTTAPQAPCAKDSSPGGGADDIKIPVERALSEEQVVMNEEEEGKAGSVAACGAGEMEPGSRSAVFEGGSFQSGSHSAVEFKDRQTEEEMTQARQKRAAQDIFIEANNEHRKRQKRELHKYQKRWQKYLEYLTEAENRRLESSVRKMKEGWKRTLEYSRQYEDPPAHVTEDRQAREERYRRQLQDEMNRRWQKQAGRLKEQKDKGRQKFQELEKTYTQSILKAFTSMPLTDNLAVEDVEEEEKVEEGDISVTVPPPSKPTMAEPTEPGSTSNHLSKSTSGQEAAARRGITGNKTTAFSTCRTGSTSQSVTSMQRTKSKDSKGKQNAKRRGRPSSSLESSGKGRASPSTYPTRTRTLGNDDPKPHPADEVCIYVPQELLVQTMDPGWEGSASESDMRTDKVGNSLIPEPATLSLQNARAPKCEGLTTEERDRLEDLIDQLLADLVEGRLDKDQLLQLVTACAALTHSSLLEQATSTTSLGMAHASDTSMVSGSDRPVLKRSTWEDREEWDFGQLTSGLVEDVVRDNIYQLSQDLHDGTLSREDVREIGSAVASAILGEMPSDSTLLGDEVVWPTLECVLREGEQMEGEQMEEEVVDQTVASLLSASDQAPLRADKSVWMVIKDFVVELLQRTGDAMENGRLETGEFHSRMEQCQKTALLSDMDLPCQHELMEVLTLGIGKLQAIEQACPVLCELVKVLLDQGHAILTRHDASKLYLPKFDVASLEVVSASACGLEVALEVGATVADGLYSDMVADREFQDSLFLSLSPSLLLVLLTCWAEMSAAVPKETVALQTTFGEVGYVPTLGEDVVLLSLFRLWRDILQDRLPSDLLTLLTLQVAQLPVLGQAPCTMQYDPEGRVVMSEDMTKKVSALAKLVRDEAADYAECQKLLSCVLQLYVRQGVLQQQQRAARGPAIPDEVLEDTKVCRYHMADLANNVVREVLEGVLVKARQQQAVTDPRKMNFMLVTDILQIMSDCALANLKDSLLTPNAAATPSPLNDSHLLNVVRATTSDTTIQAEQEAEVVGFVKRVVEMVEASPKQTQRSIVLEADYRTAGQLIKGQLGTMAVEVCEMMCGMVAPPRQEVTSSNVLDKMTRFLVSLLQECQHSLQGLLLTPEEMYKFLCSVIPSVTYKEEELQHSADGQLELLASFIHDLQEHRSKSFVFRMLVRKLSKMSLDSSDSPDVAEGMAAIAQVLSRVEPAIVNQFVQGTLYSLLASIRDAQDTQQPSRSQEMERSSRSTSMTGMELVSSGEVKSLLMPKEAEESTMTTVSSILGSSTDTAAGFPDALPPKDSASDSEELEVDADSKFEISHEADIIIHIALQTTLERLGLDSGLSPALTPLQHSTNREAGTCQEVTGLDRDSVASKEVKELVVNIQNVASQTRPPMPSDFSDLDPTIAAYAQGLLVEVTQHIEDSEEEGSDDEHVWMNMESIASTILSKTFRSIETGLSTGKLTPQPTAMDRGGSTPQRQSKDYLTGLPDRSSLSCCVTNTLCVVRSELDLMQLAAGGSEEEVGDGPPPPVDTSHILKKARQIIDFLIQQLQHDIQAARVEFRWSSQQKLSVVRYEDRERLGPVDSDVWTASTPVLNDVIVKTFRRVLKEMESQNQFFNPDMHEAESVEQSSDIFTLPSLPFLLDEFILSHLRNITTQFLHYANNEDIDHASITKEAVLVTCSLNYILREMGGLAKPASPSAADEEECNRKKIVFKVLDENSTRLLSDICGIHSERIQTIIESHKKNLQDSGMWRKEEREKAEEKIKGGSKKEGKKAPAFPFRRSLVAYRPLLRIQSDLTTLLASVKGLKTAVVPDRVSAEEEFSEEEYNRDILFHAINQITVSVKKDNVADFVLQCLFDIFVKDPSESQDSQRATLLQGLDELATAVLDGKIPQRKLASIAAEVTLLEKRHVEDPRRFAQLMRKVSLNCTGFSPEYLKMAVADLLAGYRRASDPAPETEAFMEPLSDQAEPADDSESKRPYSSLGDIGRPVVMAMSSIEARTISKINLSDDSDNRENIPTVYSTQVILKGSPLSGPGRTSVIEEQNETLACYSDTSDSDESGDTDVQPRGEDEDQDSPVKEPTDSTEVMVDSNSWDYRMATQNKEQDKATQEDNLTTEGEGGKESDKDSKHSSVKGEGDTEEERGAERQESKSSVETGKDSKPSSVKGDKTPASCDSGTREDAGDVKPEQGDQSAKSSRRSSLTDTSEWGQEGGEVKEATSESSRGHGSEECLASPEGDHNTSAIRTVRQDLVCQMDEVKELEVLPPKNNLQSLLNCQHLCKQQNKNQNLSIHQNKDQNLCTQQNKNQNLSIHQNKDQNLCTQQNKNQHSPEQQSKQQLSGAWQDKFFTVQKNESGCLPVQKTENKRLIIVRQNECDHLPVQPNRDQKEQSERPNEGHHFPRKQTAIQHFPLLQNKGQPFPGQQVKNPNLKDRFHNLRNKNHLLQIKDFYNSKDTNQKLISQKTENQYLRGYQNVDQLLSIQESTHQHQLSLRKNNRREKDEDVQSESTKLVAGCQQASETRKTPVQNMCEGQPELSAEAEKCAKQGTRFLHKFRAAQGFSVQPVKTNMQINSKNKSTEGLWAYQGPTKESSFSTFDTSLTPSNPNLTSQTKVSFVSSEGVSMPCSVLLSSQLDSVHSSSTAPTKELSRHAPTWHPYLENQRASKPFSSRGLAGPEKRAQQRAFESGFSIFDSRQRNKSKPHQKQTCNNNVNRVELECQNNGNTDGAQPATQTLPRMSSSPTVSGQRNSVQSLVAIYQPSALAPLSRSVQRSSAQSQGLARSACKQRDFGTVTELSADQHPPSTHQNSPVRDSRETRKNKSCHHQHSVLCSHASEISTLEERSKTKETPESSAVLPFSLFPQSPDIDGQQRRKGCASQGSCAHPSVTFPRIPTPSSNKDVRKEAGKLVRRSVVADELTGSQPCGERTNIERWAKDILERGSNSQSKLMLPHPPKEAPRVAVDDLRFKLCNVLQGLKNSQRGSMDKQKHSLGSTTENPETKSSSKTDSKRQYGAREMQPKTHTILTDHRQMHHSNMKEFEPDKRDSREKVHSKHGYMTSTIGVPGFVSQPKIPHPPKQPPPDQNEYTPGVNRHKETSVRWYENPRHPGNVSSRQQTSAVDRAVSNLRSPGQTRHQLPPGALRDAQGNTHLVPQCPCRSRPLQCHSRKKVKLFDGR